MQCRKMAAKPSKKTLAFLRAAEVAASTPPVCGMRGVRCEVWGVGGGVWGVGCVVWDVGCGVWGVGVGCGVEC